MGPAAAILSCGKRLHLQHGPIDLIIGADGARGAAFEAAEARFATILQELVGELPSLRMAMSDKVSCPDGHIARRMHDAALRFTGTDFLTRMAAVAGSVADEVLQAMVKAADLRRAYVNNGGDIALHLEPGQVYSTAMQSHDGRTLGHIHIRAQDPVRGIATSGRYGRSLSLGIADSVTVLARNAALADVGATLVANAVDLPGHPLMKRRAARDIVDDSDLGGRLVVTGCGVLDPTACDTALNAGRTRAETFITDHKIHSAALFLQGQAVATQDAALTIQHKELAHVQA